MAQAAFGTAKEGVEKIGEAVSNPLAPTALANLTKGTIETAFSPLAGIFSGVASEAEKAGIPAESAMKTVGEALNTARSYIKDRLVEVNMATTGNTKEQAEKIIEETVMPNLEAVGEIGTVAVTPETLAVAGRGIKSGAKALGATAEKVIAKGGELLKGTSKIDDLVSEVDEFKISPNMSSAEKSVVLAKQAEAGLPELTRAERRASVSPTTKKFILEEPEKARTYIEQAKAAKADPKNSLGALGYGGQRVDEVAKKAQSVLDDTGSEIGKFRIQNASKKVLVDDMVKIENGIIDNFEKLNLELSGGEVRQIAGKQVKASPNEIKQAQQIWDNYKILDKNPTMEELIEFRDNVSNNINFAKQAKEVSNNLDSISRQIRSETRRANLNIIPAEQAKLLDEYTELVSSVSELNKYVNSKSGGEFLLKRVLSERDRAPKELFDVLKKYTGEDLYNDAIFAQLAVSLVDDPRQLGLFRQEIGKAAADTAISFVTGRNLQAAKSALETIQGLYTPTQLKAYEKIIDGALSANK
jgi:hypothetical protein